MSSIRRFIWRFPLSKFEHLPSCSTKSLSSIEIPLLTKDNELLFRQQLTIFIYHLGQHINVSFTCIYTGVIYMHRFFMLHPFQQFHKEIVAAACLFLSCKVNEMARPLNEFSRSLYQILHSNSNSEHFSTLSLSFNQQIIDYENILLSTLGFCLNIEQPYLILTRISQRLSIPIEITEKANDIATKSIFFTLFSLKYTTNLIACFALYLAIKTSSINIPNNEDGSQWFQLFNEDLTEKFLEDLVEEYQLICLNQCSQEIYQRFQQLHNDKKMICQTMKSKINGEQSNSTNLTNDLHQQQNLIKHEYNEISRNDQTPIRSSLVSIPQVDDYSPKLPKLNINGQHHENNNSIIKSSAKPIPTLMTSTNLHSSHHHHHHHHANGHPYPSRFSIPIFQPPILSPTEQIYRSFAPSISSSSLPLHIQQQQQQQQQYSTNYVLPSSYYPQQQAPLFYSSHENLTNLNHKRYGDPPAPPIKRFRYNLNAYQHY